MVRIDGKYIGFGRTNKTQRRRVKPVVTPMLVITTKMILITLKKKAVIYICSYVYLLVQQVINTPSLCSFNLTKFISNYI